MMAKLSNSIVYMISIVTAVIHISHSEIPYYYEWKPDDKKFHELTQPIPPDSRWGKSPTYRTDAPNAKDVFKYQGQALQDKICIEMFNDKRDGYFVDLAAHKWKEGSNTYIPEYFNDWKGICIEANPKDLIGLLSNRKCKLYVNPVGTSTGQLLKFDFRENNRKKGGAFGGLVGSDFDNHANETATDVWTVSLSDILDHANAPTAIDYLSLDIEGAEYFALKNFPFEKRKFYMITIERPTRQLHHLLVNNGYLFASELTRGDFGECLYLHNGIENLEQKMTKYFIAAPPPKWHGQIRGYLMHPHWNGSYADYRQQVQRIAIHSKEAKHPSAHAAP